MDDFNFKILTEEAYRVKTVKQRTNVISAIHRMEHKDKLRMRTKLLLVYIVNNWKGTPGIIGMEELLGHGLNALTTKELQQLKLENSPRNIKKLPAFAQRILALTSVPTKVKIEMLITMRSIME